MRLHTQHSFERARPWPAADYVMASLEPKLPAPIRGRDQLHVLLVEDNPDFIYRE